jgi:formate hydrogenlyase transcriptional activator
MNTGPISDGRHRSITTDSGLHRHRCKASDRRLFRISIRSPATLISTIMTHSSPEQTITPRNGSSSSKESSDLILPLAALFDGEFSIDWIVELTDCKVSRVITILEEAVRSNRLTHQGSSVYSFRQEKDRRALIEAMPPERRLDFHDRIVRILLRDLPDDDTRTQLLADHLLQTRNDLERTQWLCRAGSLFLRAFKAQQAFQCFAKALEDLAKLTGDEADRLFAETAIRYSKISTARHETAKVIATLNDALARSLRTGNRSCQALLEMHIAKNEWLRGGYNDALAHFDRGWKLASELNDPNLRRSATTFSTFFLYWQGRFREAVKHHEHAVHDVENFPQDRFPLLAAITLGYCYAQIGQVTQGLGMIDAICSLCLERGDLNLAAYTAGNMGAIMLDIQRLDEAIEYLRDSNREATAAHNDWVYITGRLLLAYGYFRKGEDQRCIRYFREFLKQRQQIQAGVNLYSYHLALLWAMEEGLLPPIRGYSLSEEVALTIGSANIYMKGVAYRYQALWLKKQQRPQPEIMQALEQSLRWLTESGHQFELAETRLELARQYLNIGDRKRAKELTATANKALSAHDDYDLPDDLRSLIDEPPVNEELLKNILTIGQKISLVADNKDIVRQVLSAVNKMTGAERGAMFLLDDREGVSQFRLRASKNLTSAQIGHPDFASSMKLLETVARTGKGQIISADIQEKAAAADQIRSRICVPMILRDKVIGVLYHDNRLLSSAFRHSDLELLSFFAAQAAFALDNARAYNEIRQLNQKLKQEKDYYREEHIQHAPYDTIIGESPAIRQVLIKVEQVAQTEATTLILGQTGVGKELVARAIHNQSRRRDKPFIRVHCSALPENLIPSELFGHEKGAFTGATNRRIGRFELADGGTLFLDEIGDIPADVQVRLLRVLQTREFERVGGSETLSSDFRLIAATNKDLEAEVKANRFRADLYYRLNVFPLQIPSLRERRSDIPLLVDYFLNRFSQKMSKTFEAIADEELEKLLHYEWPGNVRELENVIERGAILSRGPRFRVPELTIPAGHGAPTGPDVSLQAVERRHILWALEKTRWKIRGDGGAAELLKIHPSTLHFRMKKLGIKRPSSIGRSG